MYEEHSLFVTPKDSAALWRYMDFTKYVSLLQLSALHFAQADLLGDPFEGARSRMNLLLRPALYENKIPDEAFEWFDDYSRRLRTSTFINCWHESTHESAALWKLYAPDGQGIALQTTCGRLKECLETEDTVYIGRANYVDFDNTFIPERNSLAPFTYKRREYAHEHEVRAVIRHETRRTDRRSTRTGCIWERTLLLRLARQVGAASHNQPILSRLVHGARSLLIYWGGFPRVWGVGAGGCGHAGFVPFGS